MEWTEIIISVAKAAAEEATAVVTGVFDGGLYIEDYSDLEEGVRRIAHIDLIEQELLQRPRDIVKIHLYLSPDETPAPLLEKLRSRLLAAGVENTIHTQGVLQEDWETSWKQYYHPIEIGKRLAVTPSWENYKSQRVTLRLDPGMAFGTGTHETTYLCMELLDEMVKGGEKVLDVGTGSGILAIAALLLGASKADGVDIDPMCVRTANENAMLNHVEQNFTVKVGDLTQQATGPYDIILANIVADAIIRLCKDIPPLLAAGAPFIASGIIDEREADVTAALLQQGLHVKEVFRKNGWVALVAYYNAPPATAQ